MTAHRNPPSAREVLEPLVGRLIHTISGQPNRILGIEASHAIVATGKSPDGQPVPLEWIQSALNRLYEEDELEISVESVGYRSAFIGAVLATSPGATCSRRPQRV